MRLFVKLMCMILALVMICPAIISCNNKNENSEDTTVGEIATDKETSADTTTAAEEATTVLDIDRLPAVVFCLDYEGSQNITVEYKVGEKLALPEDPTRDGYAFKGWFEQQNGQGNRVTVATQPDIAEGQTITYYAYWQESIDMTNRNKIRIGGFNGITESRANEDDFKLLAEAGIDEIYMTFFHDDDETYSKAKSLQYVEWMEKYGIKCWFNDFKMNDLLKQHAPKDEIMALLNVYKDSPAFIGNYLADEPVGDSFAELSTACEYYSELMPGYQMYVNLLPNFAASAAFYPDAETGKYNYDAYARAFCELFPCTYVSQDFYPISTKNGKNRQLSTDYYKSLYSTATAARDYNKEHWMYIYTMDVPIAELNQNYTPGLDEIRFEAFNAMAFGCCGITMYCFDCPPSYYNSGVCSGFIYNHEKSAIFEPGKQVISEIKALSEVYPNYIWQETCGVSNGSGAIKKQVEKFVKPASDYMEEVAVENANLLIGVFDEANGDGKAYMIVNEMDLNDPQNATVTVKLTGAQKVTAYIGTTSTVLEAADGYNYQFTVEPGQGCFLTVEY